jgi:hypothetical protein
MIHLSRFIIGVRHSRIFRIKNLSGDIIDKILKAVPDKFSRVTETQPNDETILTSTNDTQLVRFNRDDIIFEYKKIFDFEPKAYLEINKQELLTVATKVIPIFTESLRLGDDFMRVGIVFEFRIPKWSSLGDKKIDTFIAENFISFATKDTLEEGAVRLVYKLRAPGGGAIKKLEDFRNTILRIEESIGINESGKEEKCLFISADIQHIFKPLRKNINIDEHYTFSIDHLKSSILPILKDKGIEIVYE